ncbi:hypothetical protein [Stieleria magnilauensis]|uniref:hypothetical protein n=1 Tax=Stieleria magnilauensis TaxID=2527963 RepID=UPI003AF9D2D7
MCLRWAIESKRGGVMDLTWKDAVRPRPFGDEAKRFKLLRGKIGQLLIVRHD